MDEETRMFLHYLGSDPMSDYYRERIADAFRKEAYRRDRDEWIAGADRCGDDPAKQSQKVDQALRMMARDLNGHAPKTPDEESRKAPPAPHYEYY